MFGFRRKRDNDELEARLRGLAATIDELLPRLRNNHSLAMLVYLLSLARNEALRQARSLP